MKIGNITRSNSKGQIVIPKEIRTKLGIDDNMALNLIVRGNGIYITPIEEVITKTERETSYLDLLEKTQGSWAKDDWNTVRNRRTDIELSASKKRKKAW